MLNSILLMRGIFLLAIIQMFAYNFYKFSIIKNSEIYLIDISCRTIKMYNKSSIYIVILIQQKHSPRTSFLLKAWGNEFSQIEDSTFSIYTSIREDRSFIDPNLETKYNFHFVQVPQEDIPSYQSFVYLDYKSAREFYENTTHYWYLRTSYDALIHIPNLYKLLNYLNSKYDAKKDVVFKGHHCSTFVHGGSGWLMSRACVKKYLDLENYCMEKYKKNIAADDVNINYFIEKMRFTPEDIHTPTFVGWPVKTFSYDLLINSSFDYSVIKQPCNTKLQICRVNEIVSWHNRQKIDYVNTIGKKIINEAPDDLGLHFYPHVGGEFCRLQKKFTAYI